MGKGNHMDIKLTGRGNNHPLLAIPYLAYLAVLMAAFLAGFMTITNNEGGAPTVALALGLVFGMMAYQVAVLFVARTSGLNRGFIRLNQKEMGKNRFLLFPSDSVLYLNPYLGGSLHEHLEGGRDENGEFTKLKIMGFLESKVYVSKSEIEHAVSEMDKNSAKQ